MGAAAIKERQRPLVQEWGDEATVRGGDGPVRIENEYVVVAARKPE
jgi:hypothetical protein